MAFLDTVRKGFKSVARGYAGTAYPWSRMYGGGGGRNWNREAGLRYDNSIVYAAIRFACNKLSEVDIYVRRKKAGGEYEEVFDHPITELLANPNAWYDGSTMLSGWIVSELAGRGGMSYTYKHRSGGGKLIGLEYLPHFAVSPYWTPGSGKFVDHYRLTVPGGYMQIKPEDMLVQRYGPIDPLQPQLSIGPIEACLMEVCTDKEAANFTAAILHNTGVTPHMISPALKDANGDEITFSPEQRDQLKQLWKETITGDNRGMPLISSLPVSVDSLSFSPNDMNLDGIRNIAEERICAALGIPPLALHLGTGLDSSNNRASAEAVAKAAARDFVKPYMVKKSRELTRDLIPELGQPGEEVVFRIDAIEALQDDATEAVKRRVLAAGGAYKTPNETRDECGLDPIEGGDELRSNQPQQDDRTNDDDKKRKD